MSLFLVIHCNTGISYYAALYRVILCHWVSEYIVRIGPFSQGTNAVCQ